MADWTQVTACGLYPAPRLAGTDECKAPDEKQIEVCRQWIRRFTTPTKRIQTRHGSYGLKHAVEAWTENGITYLQTDPRGRRWAGPYMYIANGAFIEAALREGYRIQRAGDGSPNALFNMRIRKVGV